MKKIFGFILIALFVLASGCKKKTNSPVVKDGSDITVTLVPEGTIKPIKDTHLYVFDTYSGKLSKHVYYSTTSALASEGLHLNSGGEYLFIAVLNVGSLFEVPESKDTPTPPPNLTLSDFKMWIKGVESKYPDMLTGMEKLKIVDGVDATIRIKVSEGTANLKLPTLRLNMTFPDGALPDFKTKAARSAANYNMRVVAEVYKKGTETCVLEYSDILTNDILDLYLLPGEYDILLWVDYTSKDSKVDLYYTTSSLKGVVFNEEKDYKASTDSRDAFSLFFQATVGDGSDVIKKAITLERPLAKYRIVATDVELYKTFIDINDRPLLDDLMVTISYEGTFPNSFNVKMDKPNNSVAGIKYTSPLKDLTETTATLGSDYVFVNGTESSVKVTITIKDSSGKEIMKESGIEIQYRRGSLTTIKAAFLTAGVVNVTGGIEVETDWGGSHDYEF